MTPNFLVIGAQKSGTTWMDRNLRIHPDIWLPPEKEMHYFDLPKNIPFVFFMCAPERGDRYWVFNRLKRAYRMASANPSAINWYSRYYFLPRTDHWYQSLFSPDNSQIAGEITPDYAVMNEKKIAHVHALAPTIKIIYLMRNPIERMWSQAAMHFSERSGYQGIHTIDEETIIGFLCKPTRLAHARYFKNLQRWKKYYSPEQIFTGFFEDIADVPEQLLKSIFEFLGVTASADCISGLSAEKIFARDYPPIPRRIAHLLAGLLIDDITALHQYFNNAYTAQWLTSATAYLAVSDT
ncbi:MAG: sulfotransferase [Methylovulum sp.]|nr:sulfotransferase [Methylovulum sp.]